MIFTSPMMMQPETGGSFSPLDIPNCFLYFEADLGVTGDPVSLWEDQSTNGYDVSQGTEADRPDYQASHINGHPCVTGVSNDQLNSGAISGLAGQTKVSSMLVFNSTAGSGYPCAVGFENRVWDYHMDYAGGIIWLVLNGAGNGFYYTWAQDTSEHILTCTYDGTQGTPANRVHMYEDGVDKSLTLAGTIPTSVPSTGSFRLFRNYNGGYWVGDITLFCMHLITYSSEQRGQLESYAATKYGVTL